MKRGAKASRFFVCFMGLFDFLRRSQAPHGPLNVDLEAALRAEKRQPSPQTRAHLLHVLSRSIVLIAVRDLPLHLRDIGPGKFEKSTDLDLLGTTNGMGKQVGLIFSNHKNVQARKKNAPWIAIPGKQAANWWKGAQGLVIDPAGDWIELSREEVKKLANGDFAPSDDQEGSNLKSNDLI